MYSCIKGPCFEHVQHTAVPPLTTPQPADTNVVSPSDQVHMHYASACAHDCSRRVSPQHVHFCLLPPRVWRAHLDTAGRNYAKYSEGIGANPVKILKVSSEPVHRQ